MVVVVADDVAVDVAVESFAVESVVVVVCEVVVGVETAAKMLAQVQCRHLPGDKQNIR